MTREEFARWMGEKPRLLDGATGSNLRLRGMPNGICSEQWLCENPSFICQLQSEYIQAGSEILLAPTFGANRVLLSNFGLESQVDTLCKTLVSICRENAASRALIAGDITTTGKPVLPEEYDAYQNLFDVYCEQANALYESGVDLFVVETMMGMTECMAAAEAIRSICDLPILCTLSVQADGKCYFDGNLFEAAEVLTALGVDAIGINCSVGPDQMENLIRSLHKSCQLPIVAKPNAGMPQMADDGNAVYSMGPEEFACSMKKLMDAGATLVGGCCGTTPAHIHALYNIM